MTSSPGLTQPMMVQKRARQIDKCQEFVDDKLFPNSNFTFVSTTCNQDFCQGINGSANVLAVEFWKGLNQTWVTLNKIIGRLKFIINMMSNWHLHILWYTVATKHCLPWTHLPTHLWRAVVEQNQENLESKKYMVKLASINKQSFFIPWPRLSGLCWAFSWTNSTLNVKDGVKIKKYIQNMSSVENMETYQTFFSRPLYLFDSWCFDELMVKAEWLNCLLITGVKFLWWPVARRCCCCWFEKSVAKGTR